MNKKLIISLLFVFGLFFLIGCTTLPTCPDSCDDYDSCTIDSCSEKTDYLCDHEYIAGCCNYEHDCPTNKPFCRDNECYEKECENDNDCTEKVYVGDDYLGKEFCVSGKCVECQTDKDCYICENKWHCGSYICNEYGSCTKCKFDYECSPNYDPKTGEITRYYERDTDRWVAGRYCSVIGFCT